MLQTQIACRGLTAIFFVKIMDILGKLGLPSFDDFCRVVGRTVIHQNQLDMFFEIQTLPRQAREVVI